MLRDDLAPWERRIVRVFTAFLDLIAPANRDGVRWVMRFNWCDIDRFPCLAPIGDFFARLWRVYTAFTDCPCCLAVRFTVMLLIAFWLGTFF